MEAQLRLLSAADTEHPPPDADHAPPLDQGGGSWRLSPTTRDVGRHGIARARAALQRARGTQDDVEPAVQRRPSAA